jgi:hypothetical protein
MHTAEHRSTVSRRPSAFIGVSLLMLCPALLGIGCKGPSKPNIELRRQNQELREQVQQLQIQREAQAATIRALERQRTTVQTLPQERLDQLFTAHGVRIGRLSGGADLDPDKVGDEAIRVYVVPLDQTRDRIKLSGDFVIEAFDLSDPDSPWLGRWEFPRQGVEEHWVGQLTLYEYVFTCPWQDRVPSSEELTVRVTFTDALTGREFTDQRLIRINPPAP